MKPEFLDSRIKNEQRDRDILNSNSVNFDKDEFIQFLAACNMEKVLPNIHMNKLNDHEMVTRFRLSFIGQNRNLMLDTLAECSKCINELWRFDNNNIYNALELFWENRRIKGAGSGLSTMIMYLKDPDKYIMYGFHFYLVLSEFSKERHLTAVKEDIHIPPPAQS